MLYNKVSLSISYIQCRHHSQHHSTTIDDNCCPISLYRINQLWMRAIANSICFSFCHFPLELPFLFLASNWQKEGEGGDVITWNLICYCCFFHGLPFHTISRGERERDTIPKLNIDWLGHRVFIVSRTSRHSLHLHLFTTKCVPFFLLLFGVALSTSNRYLICCSLWRTIETLWTGIIFLFLSLFLSLSFWLNSRYYQWVASHSIDSWFA